MLENCAHCAHAKSVILNIFSTTPPLSNCPLFQAPSQNTIIVTQKKTNDKAIRLLVSQPASVGKRADMSEM